MRSLDSYADYQVMGQNLRHLILGLGSFWLLANRFMLEENLGTSGPDGLVQIDPEAWYPLVSNLRVIARVRKDFGEVAVRQSASHIPTLARFPPTVADIHSAFDALDMAYHMNHGVNGRALYCPETGVMQEGIGHFRSRSIPGQKQILCQCTTPYSCCFDEGLLLALAQRYEPSASITHLEPLRCRAHGSESCTYSILWT